MITEAKFKYALKDMMKAMPLEDVNVTALCQKCGCHRQTFYYHYQDIYDLIAAIFLNEDLGAVDRAKTPQGALDAILKYAKENFSFLRSTYNSAARDLTEDFIFGKLNAKFLSLWTDSDKSIGLKKEGARTVARRFAHFVSDEFGNCFRDPHLTPEKFITKMSRFHKNAIAIVLPSYIAMSKKEEAK